MRYYFGVMCTGALGDALALFGPVPGLTPCIIGPPSRALTILSGAILTIALPVGFGAMTGAIALCAVTHRADDALLATAGTVEKSGTGRDDVLLARITTSSLHKVLTIQAPAADKHFDHAMHGCLWMRCRGTPKSLGTASISCLSCV